MKKFITAVTAASLGTLLVIPAVAQDNATEQMRNNSPVAAGSNGMAAQGSAKMATGQISTSALLNNAVLNQADQSIGDVNDVILDSKGNVTSVIVGVGGFLGIGEKDVALPFSQLTIGWNNDNDLVVKTTATKETLKSAPQYVKPHRT